MNLVSLPSSSSYHVLDSTWEMRRKRSESTRNANLQKKKKKKEIPSDKRADTKDFKGTWFCLLMVQEVSGACVLTGASSQSCPLGQWTRKSKSQHLPYAPRQCPVAEELTADTIHCVWLSALCYL